MAESHLSRRRFLRGEFLSSLQSKNQQIQGMNRIRLPWAVESSLFTQGCTRCGDCITACETQILIRGDGGYPEIRFAQGECTFCQACVQICQQPIFRPFDETPWEHKVSITERCLAYGQVECRSCEDVCETRAIRFQRQLGKVAQPLLNLADCSGCGACIAVCPRDAINILNIE